MPSRIDIGPEGGPFVAINENSNDLELQDINGNVIAVWDETAGQWDLNNNSLTNINAIDASSATFGGLSAANETFVELRLSSESGLVASGNEIIPYDTTTIDSRDETSGQEITVDKAGLYKIEAGADIRGNTSQGDNILCSIQDTNGDAIDNQFKSAPDQVAILNFSFFVNLDQGQSIKITITNENSDFLAFPGAGNATAHIIRSVVQP